MDTNGSARSSASEVTLFKTGTSHERTRPRKPTILTVKLCYFKRSAFRVSYIMETKQVNGRAIWARLIQPFPTKTVSPDGATGRVSEVPCKQLTAQGMIRVGHHQWLLIPLRESMFAAQTRVNTWHLGRANQGPFQKLLGWLIWNSCHGSFELVPKTVWHFFNNDCIAWIVRTFWIDSKLWCSLGHLSREPPRLSPLQCKSPANFCP